MQAAATAKIATATEFAEAQQACAAYMLLTDEVTHASLNYKMLRMCRKQNHPYPNQRLAHEALAMAEADSSRPKQPNPSTCRAVPYNRELHVNHDRDAVPVGFSIWEACLRSGPAKIGFLFMIRFTL